MTDQRLLRDLHLDTGGTIVFLVLDGLGGREEVPGGPTELEVAVTPHLDRLAREGITGSLDIVQPGITPGSGAGHLALFGYDPLEQLVERGVLSALGIDFPLEAGDVAARGNFCTMDADGTIVDRRAGRPSSEEGRRLVDLLRRSVQLEGVEVLLEPVKEHRFVLVLRERGGRPLGADVSDSDPHRPGVAAAEPRAGSEESRRTADLVRSFLEQAGEALAGEERANMVLLRGFAARPDLPSFDEAYGLSACAVADYPMYRGLAALLGMARTEPPGGPEAAIASVADRWQAHDFFFIHHKKTDSTGEDGDFDGKTAQIEAADAVIPDLQALEPDVLVVTGDHSTPASLAAHSWHPVPVLLHAPATVRRDAVTGFGERAVTAGGLGRRPAQDLMALALAHAGRLGKYGA
ncbi:2,3-bisphosphoglycerate-independent phosphoglycerate mutase [bacterium]|nr:2,3-bisphosphoglycerate-independent phosphoglycerate mutase [bacterium]